MAENIELFWLYDWTIFFVMLAILLIALAIWGYRYVLDNNDQNDTELTETIQEDIGFDSELWWGRWQYLYNHAGEFKQGVFMQKVYSLFIDALEAKYELTGQLVSADEEQLDRFDFTDQENRLIHRLYKPVFQQGEWTESKRQQLLDQIAKIVNNRGIFYSLNNE